MSNPRARGCLIFLAILVGAVFLCAIVPFVLMPAAGVAMALPVIAVPGEVVTPGGLFGIDLTNTFIGTILADVMVLIFAILAWRASRGWTKEIPGRFQGLAEVVVETLYNFLKGLGGARLRTAPLLWPLVGTIFLFLLAANLLKLFPGVETVGNLHCAHVGHAGYPVIEGTMSEKSYLLYVTKPLDGGEPQTEATEHACHEFYEGHVTRFDPSGFASNEAVIADLEAQLAAADGEAAEVIEQRIASAQTIAALTPEISALQTQIDALKAAPADDGHGETADGHGEAVVTEPEAAVVTDPEATAVEGEAATEGESTEVVLETTDALTEEVVVVQPVTDLATAEEELFAKTTALNLAQSQLQYPHATLALSAEDLEKGAIPYIFQITPFVRGAATDLSLTIAFAIMTVVIVQIYGIYAQGPAYFEKFVNLSALGNLKKKPLGAIDFIVGLFEIISELGKIISLAFRLFGNLFAGGVALIAIAFLMALLVPGVIYLLELVIGAVQALVFSVLTLVFVVQAMESHHGGDDDHHDGHEAEAAHH